MNSQGCRKKNGGNVDMSTLKVKKGEVDEEELEEEENLGEERQEEDKEIEEAEDGGK